LNEELGRKDEFVSWNLCKCDYFHLFAPFYHHLVAGLKLSIQGQFFFKSNCFCAEVAQNGLYNLLGFNNFVEI